MWNYEMKECGNCYMLFPASDQNEVCSIVNKIAHILYCLYTAFGRMPVGVLAMVCWWPIPCHGLGLDNGNFSRATEEVSV